ncbi:MAG: efflux RND transporter periplasmic adaptor subunit [Planctomycetes bacterium]|nr:efflux RND transporter periplasmic adaptor subunit [Planctomycetota bacterium]
MVKKWLKNKKIFQLVLVIAILIFGVVVLKGLSALKKPPAKKARVVVVPLLNAITVEMQDIQMVVESFGTAQAKVQVQIIPQVSGKIVACHPDFVNGGFFSAGQSLVKIDPIDYELAVENAEAAVARSEVLVEREQSEGAIAAAEWAQLNEGQKPSSSLVLREPQIRQAKAELKAATAQLEKAKLNLKRTDVSVPFNGRISQESVDIGQYIMAGQSIATVYGTDAIEIIIPLEDEEMAWFDVPFSSNGSKPGSKAVVMADFAGGEHTWAGRVVRTEGTVDQSSRMVNVVVEVADPFALSNGRPPLVPGMFIDVKIQGKKLTGVFRVPRYVVHNNDHVWVEREGKLHIEKVEIIRMDIKHAYIGSGLESDDVIITSPLDTVTDKMNVRVNISN